MPGRILLPCLPPEASSRILARPYRISSQLYLCPLPNRANPRGMARLQPSTQMLMTRNKILSSRARRMS